MQPWKKLVAGTLAALFLVGGGFVKVPQAAPESGQKGKENAQVAAGAAVNRKVIIEVDAPPVLRRPVSFPVAVIVTNTGEKGQDLVLEELQVQDVDHPERHRTRLVVGARLEGIGRDLEEFDKLKEKVRKAKEQGVEPGVGPEEMRKKEKNLEKGKRITKVTVDLQQYAAELKPGKVLRLKVSVVVREATPGGNEGTKGSVISKIKEIPVEPPLERPPVPPGASHSDWYFGDTHTHSTYTWDYWFGNGIYTIPELKSLALAAGLDWITLTDHSYCLDSSKYAAIKNETTSLCDGNFSFLYGEELSVREIKDGQTADLDTAHYAAVLNETFIPSVTNIFRQCSSPDSQQGIDQVKQAGGAVVINHPGWGDRWPESWNFNLKTYPWTHGETGIELINGPWDDPDLGAFTRWVEQRLLKGEKVAAFAASDTESQNQLGTAMTVPYTPANTQQNIKTTLLQGRHYVTTGPGLAIWAKLPGDSAWHWMGKTLPVGSGTQITLCVSRAWSAGNLEVRILKGRFGTESEETVDVRTLPAGSGSYTLMINVPPGSYVRAQAVDPGRTGAQAFTTPLWFS